MARMRSTGLGKTELHAQIVGLRPDQDLLILELKTVKPVKWHIRAGLQPEDRLKLLKLMLKLNFKLLKFVVNWNPNKGNHPEPAEF
jgi:hypothetical protein